ncbi:MAG TPA: hypothetical protein VGP99_04775 [Tepidisphaeraceae bacterium]|jgi:hypothetical protein|nr:hypothetical protein [Tepidisphaeraceae bacterium]
MFELFWELNQQRRIGEAQADARNSEARARDLDHQVELLQQAIEKLALVNAAMWSLLQQKAGLKDEELANRMQQIDMQDGVADGRISPQRAMACAKCHRPLSRTHERCMYCGAYNPGARNAFDVT